MLTATTISVAGLTVSAPLGPMLVWSSQTEKVRKVLRTYHPRDRCTVMSRWLRSMLWDHFSRSERPVPAGSLTV